MICDLFHCLILPKFCWQKNEPDQKKIEFSETPATGLRFNPGPLQPLTCKEDRHPAAQLSLKNTFPPKLCGCVPILSTCVTLSPGQVGCTQIAGTFTGSHHTPWSDSLPHEAPRPTNTPPVGDVSRSHPWLERQRQGAEQ